MEEVDNNESLMDTSEVFIGDEDITKEEAMADVSKRGLYLLQNFFRTARMTSKGNDFMIKLYFHAIMGAYLKEYTVTKVAGVSDLRVPVIWIQNSSSGKSQLNKCALDICRKIGVNAIEETSFTEAGMIGQFDKSKHDFNIKNNLRPGENQTINKKDGTTRTVTYSPPVIYGDLYHYDIIFVDEGKILFQKTRYTESFLSVLQPAMDYPGKVRKKLAAEEPIEYDCGCTLVVSTTEWGNVGYDVMSQGFFPRCLFYMKNLSIQEYLQNVDGLYRNKFDDYKYRNLMGDFADMIERHPIPITRDRKRIFVDNELMPLIHESVRAWFIKLSERLYGSEITIAKSFASRLQIFVFKIAGQMAVLNHKTNPHIPGDAVFIAGRDEVDYALGLTNSVFDSLLNTMSVEEDSESSKMYSTIIKVIGIMKKECVEKIPKSRFIELIMSTRTCGRTKAVRTYNAMLSANYLREEIDPVDKSLVTLPNWSIWINKDKEKMGGIYNGKEDDMQETQSGDQGAELPDGFEM
ncbi:MAG: hypothetical protein D4S01_08805 [Dehalococcoidia bacterium]|nr:MAG: hypothetical protein D4S01_08805 [Dehalococcoidia bacterium]